MHEFIFFIIGCLLGIIMGIVTMCLVQVNHLHDNDFNKKDENK